MSCVLRRRWKNEQSPAIMLSRFEQDFMDCGRQGLKESYY